MLVILHCLLLLHLNINFNSIFCFVIDSCCYFKSLVNIYEFPLMAFHNVFYLYSRVAGSLQSISVHLFRHVPRGRGIRFGALTNVVGGIWERNLWTSISSLLGKMLISEYQTNARETWSQVPLVLFRMSDSLPTVANKQNRPQLRLIWSLNSARLPAGCDDKEEVSSWPFYSAPARHDPSPAHEFILSELSSRWWSRWYLGNGSVRQPGQG